MNERFFILLLCSTSVVFTRSTTRTIIISSPIHLTCRMHTRYSTQTLYQIIIDMSPHYSNAVLCYWNFSIRTIYRFLGPSSVFCQSKKLNGTNECIVAMIHNSKSFLETFIFVYWISNVRQCWLSFTSHSTLHAFGRWKYSQVNKLQIIIFESSSFR